MTDYSQPLVNPGTGIVKMRGRCWRPRVSAKYLSRHSAGDLVQVPLRKESARLLDSRDTGRRGAKALLRGEFPKKDASGCYHNQLTPGYWLSMRARIDEVLDLATTLIELGVGPLNTYLWRVLR